MCSSPNGDENFVESKALLDYSKLSEGAEVVKPSSMALSEFHFLLLIGNKVKVRVLTYTIVFLHIAHVKKIFSLVVLCMLSKFKHL